MEDVATPQAASEPANPLKSSILAKRLSRGGPKTSCLQGPRFMVCAELWHPPGTQDPL